jgi:hypothetical protein
VEFLVDGESFVSLETLSGVPSIEEVIVHNGEALRSDCLSFRAACSKPLTMTTRGTRKKPERIAAEFVKATVLAASQV